MTKFPFLVYGASSFFLGLGPFAGKSLIQHWVLQRIDGMLGGATTNRDGNIVVWIL